MLRTIIVIILLFCSLIVGWLCLDLIECFLNYLEEKNSYTSHSVFLSFSEFIRIYYVSEDKCTLMKNKVLYEDYKPFQKNDYYYITFKNFISFLKYRYFFETTTRNKEIREKTEQENKNMRDFLSHVQDDINEKIKEAEKEIKNVKKSD